MVEKTKCLIIGSGPAGYAAAIYAARADLNPILYEGVQPGGQLTETTDVDNYPGYSEGINGPQMMLDFKNQAARFKTDIRPGFISKVNFDGSIHKVWDENDKEIHCQSVIIATGASAKWLGLPSETRLRESGGGVSACAVCDGFFYKKQEVIVVGGGDTASEEATYLAKLCSKVTVLIRKDKMRASKAMQKRVLSCNNIEVLYNHETKKLNGKESIESVTVINNITNKEKEISCTGFFVAIGHKPNTDIFKDYIKTDELGYIINEAGTSKTNIEGVFVAGDAADKIYRQAVTAAGTGCMAALDAERYLSEKTHNIMNLDTNKIIYCCLIFFVVQTIIWFQVNSQFIPKWEEWSKNNLFLIALIGIPVSILIIKGTQLGYEGFNELLWPQRLILFCNRNNFIFNLYIIFFKRTFIN